MNHTFYRSDFKDNTLDESYFDYLLTSVGIPDNEQDDYDEVEINFNTIIRTKDIKLITLS